MYTAKILMFEEQINRLRLMGNDRSLLMTALRLVAPAENHVLTMIEIAEKAIAKGDGSPLADVVIDIFFDIVAGYDFGNRYTITEDDGGEFLKLSEARVRRGTLPMIEFMQEKLGVTMTEAMESIATCMNSAVIEKANGDDPRMIDEMILDFMFSIENPMVTIKRVTSERDAFLKRNGELVALVETAKVEYAMLKVSWKNALIRLGDLEKRLKRIKVFKMAIVHGDHDQTNEFTEINFTKGEMLDSALRFLDDEDGGGNDH